MIIMTKGIIVLSLFIIISMLYLVSAEPVNLAPLGIAQCSAYIQDCYKVNDDDLATWWDSHRDSADRVTILLNSYYEIGSINLIGIYFNHYSGEGKLSYYNPDTSSFVEIDKRNYPASWEVVMITLQEPIVTNALKFEVTSGTPNLALKEFQIFGIGSQSPTSLTKRVEDLEQQVANLTTEVDELKGQVQDLTEEVEGYEERFSLLESTVSLIQGVLSNDMIKLLGYLIYFPGKDMKPMICSYLLNSNETSIDDYGLHCEKTGKNMSKCSCSNLK